MLEVVHVEGKWHQRLLVQCSPLLYARSIFQELISRSSANISHERNVLRCFNLNWYIYTFPFLMGGSSTITSDGLSAESIIGVTSCFIEPKMDQHIPQVFVSLKCYEWLFWTICAQVAGPLDDVPVFFKCFVEGL